MCTGAACLRPSVDRRRLEYNEEDKNKRDREKEEAVRTERNVIRFAEVLYWQSVDRQWSRGGESGKECDSFAEVSCT